MEKLQAWLLAARLRTLPLSISGTLVAGGIAIKFEQFYSLIFLMTLLTTVAYQILSNIANDYGDGVKGTDSTHRIGPRRALQAGLLSKTELQRGMVLGCVLAVLFTTSLLWLSFGAAHLTLFILFFALGIFAIIAAIKYTVGKKAYGYFALGDVFVFLFFGILSVVGGSFLFLKTIYLPSILPAITIGFLSVAVLNLNNMRDLESDKLSQKKTLAGALGFSKSKYYHFSLISIAFIGAVCYAILSSDVLYLLTCVAFIPLGMHCIRVAKIKDPKMFDPELKKVALSTFLYSVIFLIIHFLKHWF